MTETGHLAAAFSMSARFFSKSAPGRTLDLSVTSNTSGALNAQDPHEIHPGSITGAFMGFFESDSLFI